MPFDACETGLLCTISAGLRVIVEAVCDMPVL